jgi:hypothetical protein
MAKAISAFTVEGSAINGGVNRKIMYFELIA